MKIEEMTREGDVLWKLSAEGYALEFVILDDTGEPEIEGFYKWDGCINWKTFGEHYAHMCGGMEGINRIYENLQKVDEIADREIEHS